MAACGDDDKESGDTSGPADSSASSETTGGGESGGTLVFGTSSDPVVLDGAYVSDGESLRVIDQIFETLVTTAPGGTEIEPALAESWTASDDGLEWTFNLRQGVTFHDESAFNAAAVCFNFDRWYNFTGVAQSAAVSCYWSTVFGGFSDGATPASTADARRPTRTPRS